MPAWADPPRLKREHFILFSFSNILPLHYRSGKLFTPVFLSARIPVYHRLFICNDITLTQMPRRRMTDGRVGGI